jgi:hypothetical protein
MNRLTSFASAGLLCVFWSGAQASPPSKRDVPGLTEFLGCHKSPEDKPTVESTFRPESKLPGLIEFMSTLSCTPFLIPKGVDVDKSFTLAAGKTNRVSHAEMYRLFVGVLESNRLTVHPMEKALQIVPLDRAR